MAINTKNMTTGGVGNGSVPVTATAMMDPTIHAAAPTKPYNTFCASAPVNSRHDRRMIAMPIAEEPITRRSNRAISLARPSRSTKSLSLIKSGKNANTSPTNMRTDGMTVRAVFDFIRMVFLTSIFCRALFQRRLDTVYKATTAIKGTAEQRKDLRATNVHELESLKYAHSQHFHAIILTRKHAVLESRPPLSRRFENPSGIRFFNPFPINAPAVPGCPSHPLGFGCSRPALGRLSVAVA